MERPLCTRNTYSNCIILLFFNSISRVQPEVSTVLVMFQSRLLRMVMVKEIVVVVGTAAAMASVVVVVVVVHELMMLSE